VGQSKALARSTGHLISRVHSARSSKSNDSDVGMPCNNLSNGSFTVAVLNGAITSCNNHAARDLNLLPRRISAEYENTF
jgi:hypothetical protein